MNTVFQSFNNKPLTVVIIGASGGIGQAVVQQLLGMPTISCIYGLSRSKHVLEDHRYTHISADITDEQSLGNAVEELPGSIDLVFIATGVLHDTQSLAPEKKLSQLLADNLLQSFLVNTIGPALCARYLLPKMNKRHKSVLVALSARVGSISDNRLGGWYSYRASKAALNMLIKTLSIEVKRQYPGMIIAGLHPGTVDTPLSQPFQQNVPANKLFTPEYSAQCLLNVIEQLTPEDSGACFAWDGKKIPE